MKFDTVKTLFNGHETILLRPENANKNSISNLFGSTDPIVHTALKILLKS